MIVVSLLTRPESEDKIRGLVFNLNAAPPMRDTTRA
jgi:hypothetical protein